MIVLSLFSDRTDARRTEGRKAKEREQALEGIEPGGRRLVRDLQVFAQGVDGERGSDEVGQAQHHLLEPAEILDPRKGCDFLFDEARPVRAGPATGFGLAPPEKRLGEPTELRQRRETVRVLDAGLGDRKRVETKEVISPLKGVAPVPKQLEPAAPRDEDLLPLRPGIVEALQEVAPPAILVDLVEDPEGRGRQLSPEDALPVGLDVPAQIAPGSTGQAPRERRLPDLPRPGNEHHLPVKVAPRLRRKIAGCDGHGGGKIRAFSTVVKNTRELFRFK